MTWRNKYTNNNRQMEKMWTAYSSPICEKENKLSSFFGSKYQKKEHADVISCQWLPTLLWRKWYMQNCLQMNEYDIEKIYIFTN